MSRTVIVQRDGEEIEVGRRLYVGNLSWNVRWQDLKDLFKTEGEVVYADVKMTRDGRSAGCGIVEYSTAQEAASAMQKLNDEMFEGRQLFVRQDKDDRDLGGVGGGYKGGKGGKGQGRGGDRGGRGARDGRDYGGSSRYGGGKGGYGGETTRIIVGNLDWGVTWQDLKDHFRQIGYVSRADVSDNGRSKEGTVEFEHAGDASRAIRQLNDTMFKGQYISVIRDHKGGRY